MNSKQLQTAATALLRKHGYTWAGRTKSEANKAKDDALRRAVRCPFRGKSRKS